MKVKTIGESENTILTQGVDFTISDKTVTFTTAPTGLFMIYRETTTSRLVEWADASVLTASDMTLQEVQLLHLTEETGDKVQDNGMAIDETDASWDARYARIKNLLDPKEDGDAVTLRYMNDNANAWQRKVVTEGDTQVKRVTAEGDKQVSRVTDTGDSYISTMDDKLAESNQHTVDAAASASKAKASETAAKASETKAKTSEDNAKVSETKAKTSETNAKTSETNAKASETKAKASENAAAASASNAKTSETNAKASETAAADSKTRSWSWAENTSSPSNNADTQSPTGKQQSSRSWALYSRDKALEAKEVAQGIGNPVKSVTENNGKVTVTQADGTTSQFNAGLNILARNKAYAVGDIAYSPNLPSYMYLECVTAGTTSAKEPDFSKVTTGG